MAFLAGVEYFTGCRESNSLSSSIRLQPADWALDNFGQIDLKIVYYNL